MLRPCPVTEDWLISQLPRCVRISPQDQDTGGFFVCCLRKHNTVLLPMLKTVSCVPLASKILSKPPAGAWQLLFQQFGLAPDLRPLLHQAGQKKMEMVDRRLHSVVSCQQNAKLLRVVSVGVTVMELQGRVGCGWYKLTRAGSRTLLPPALDPHHSDDENQH